MIDRWKASPMQKKVFLSHELQDQDTFDLKKDNLS